jgi:Zn-dependent M16 (insulinase) family peptidase
MYRSGTGRAFSSCGVMGPVTANSCAVLAVEFAVSRRPVVVLRVLVEAPLLARQLLIYLPAFHSLFAKFLSITEHVDSTLGGTAQ